MIFSWWYIAMLLILLFIIMYEIITYSRLPPPRYLMPWYMLRHRYFAAALRILTWQPYDTIDEYWIDEWWISMPSTYYLRHTIFTHPSNKLFRSYFYQRLATVVQLPSGHAHHSSHTDNAVKARRRLYYYFYNKLYS